MILAVLAAALLALSWIATEAHISSKGETMSLMRLKPRAHSWHDRIYALTGLEVDRGRMRLAHTARTVYESAAGGGPTGTTRIYAARIP